ncbi:MAG TPA: fused MFS/spermidine synthase [Terriglobales bacterium]|nr:fused MFS/spermidine synthase [Terriglobales bacterium]
MHRRSKRLWPVLILFFCSGATALIYEVVWSKYLAQMFGSTIYAQTVVLAVFMGGLALGNRLFGARSERFQQPVRTYGFVELAIGLYAFFFPAIYSAADKVFVALGGAVLEHSLVLLAIKAGLSLALLIGPTILMGGTLPLLAVFLQRASLESGRQSARFYSVNSLGAVFGAAIAGFYLVQSWGMVAALQLTALVNVCIAAVALLLSRAVDPHQTPERLAPLVLKGEAAEWRWAGALVALTGGISMGLEVLASRSMAMLFGSSLQSFAVVLISFILGIALGSGVVASRRWRGVHGARLVTILLGAAALWIGLLVIRIESWVDVYRVLRSGLARSTTGYVFHQFLAVALAMVVLGVPAALIGAVLPLLIRGVSGHTARLAEQVGRLLTWNTIGAVAGVLLTGFVIMPKLGLRNAFLFLALGLALAGLIASWRAQLSRLMKCSGAVCALLVTLMCVGNEGWRHVMSSGAFRAREAEVSHEAMTLRKAHIQILFYEDAPDATVDVEQGDGIGTPADVGLRLNGKTDASSRVDLSTQLLLGHIPMAACPDAKDVFVLGLGSGITGRAILAHPVEQLIIAENCEPVVRAARYFEEWNGGVLTNPVSRIWMEDARTLLKLSPKKYDVIVSQPSNPWMAGVGSVFSREYYALAASRLKEGGVMAQWFHVYDMHDGIVNLVLRTFGSVFEHMEIWDSGSGDLILLGALKPWPSEPSVFSRLFARPSARRDLDLIGIHSPEALWARQLASQNTAFAIAGPGPIQSDFFPTLEYEAPRAFYIGTNARELWQFDERTWQSDLAPVAKQRALASIDERALHSLFGRFSTANEELRGHIAWRCSGRTGASPPPTGPCLFNRTDAETAPLTIRSDTHEEVRRLLIASGDIQRAGEARLVGINAVHALLQSYGPKSDWAVGHYASLAIRGCIASGDTRRASEILSLALRLRPEDTRLAFLQRVLEGKSTMFATLSN